MLLSSLAPAEVAGPPKLGGTVIWGSNTRCVQLSVGVQCFEPDAKLIGKQLAGEFVEVVGMRAGID